MHHILATILAFLILVEILYFSLLLDGKILQLRKNILLHYFLPEILSKENSDLVCYS